MRVYKKESDAVRDIQRLVHAIPNSFICKLNLNYIAGFPDLVAGLFGHTVFFEVKRWHGKYAPAQVAMLKKMRNAGIHAYGLRCKDQNTTILSDFRAGTEHIGALEYTVMSAWRS